MRRLKTLLMFMILPALISCAGVGVVETSDPHTKLNDAWHLSIKQNRPLIAEKLIFEAMEIFKAQQDFHGLGHAHRQYAEFLLSKSVISWETFYIKNGFRDKNISFRNRNLAAKDYYGKAISYYERSVRGLKSDKKYDALTNVYYNLAKSLVELGQRKEACLQFALSANAYTKNVENNPGRTQYLPRGYASYEQLIADEKKAIGCQT